MSSVRSGSYPRKYSQMPLGPTGLVVQGEYGTERLVFTDQQICDDLIATIPKLHDAVRRDMRGEQWKPTPTPEGVEKYELVPVAAGADGDDDLDLIHAIVAKTELKCHINEVLNVLVNQDSSTYDATMKALNGKKFSQGDVLFQQKCKLVPEPAATKSSSRFSVSSRGDTADDQQTAQSGLIAVKLATIKPKFGFSFSRKFKRTQKLCLATFTHKYPSNDRAVHIIKTLPKKVHDQIVSAENRSSLRRDLDHLSVGFDIQFFPKPGEGSIDQTTRVVAHGYASTTSPDSLGNLSQKRIPRYNAAELAKRREAIMNPEAKHVLNLLTDSLAQFERVIRRRRIGLQSFIYFPKGYDDPEILKSCAICVKPFKFYRRDFFCQLCGQMSCGECSKLHEVETRVGEVRQNRVCLTCVERVDKCVFDDEDIVEALGPVVVASDDREWYDDDRFHLDAEDSSETASTTSTDHSDAVSVSSSTDRSSVDSMTAQLHSDDPEQWSLALETLGRLVAPAAQHEYTYMDQDLQAQSNAKKEKKKKKAKSNRPKTLEQKVRQDVENHLSYSLRLTKDKYKPEELPVASKARDYKLEYDPSRTYLDQPLAPIIETEKNAKRVEYIRQKGLMEPEQDLSALNVIVQVAAKRMNCPVGFISVVDDTKLRAVATFPQMKLSTISKHDVMCAHTLYEEKPLIVNPLRDMRFRFREVQVPSMIETRFYAGFPVRGPDGLVFAQLCTVDDVAHNHITAKEYASMEALAELAASVIAQKTS